MIPGVPNLLKATWRLYRSSIALLSGYLAWLLLPQIGLVLIPLLPVGPWTHILESLLVIVSIILSLWVSLIVIRILSAAATGRHESLPAVIASSKERFLPFVFAGVLQLLVIVGGFILLIIPGFIFAVRYQFAPLAAALDRAHGLQALSASRKLSAGRFFPVLWRLLAGPIVLTAWYAMIMSIIFIPLMIMTGMSIDILTGDHPPIWFTAFDAIGQLFFLTPLLLAYLVLLYHSLTE